MFYNHKIGNKKRSKKKDYDKITEIIFLIASIINLIVALILLKVNDPIVALILLKAKK